MHSEKQPNYTPHSDTKACSGSAADRNGMRSTLRERTPVTCLPRRTARSLIAVALAVVALGVAAGAASAAQPIEGRWTFGDQVADIYSVGNGNFSLSFAGPSNPVGNCAPEQTPGNWLFSGSAFHYTGKVTFYNTQSCESVGDGSVDVTLRDNDNGTLSTEPPPGIACCGHSDELKRVADPLDVFSGTLAQIVNRGLTQIRAAQATLSHLKGRRRTRRYAGIRSVALATKSAVNKYKVTTPDEATLRPCALKWFNYVAAVAAKHSTTAVAAGAKNLAKCLSPFRDLFPGGKPGTTVPKKGPAKPKQAPPATSRADNWFGTGTDPNLIPRIDFAYDPANRVDKIRNINMSVRVACLGKVFYLALTPEYFPELGFGSAGFGSGSGPVTYASFPGDQPNQFYDLEIYLSGSIDSATTAHGTIKVQRRQGSNTTFCGSSGFKRWYATRK